MHPHFSYEYGFTLLELIISIAITGVISVISASAYTGYIETTKNSEATLQIRGLALLINDYAFEYGEYPESLTDIGNANLKDPWGNPYTYFNLHSSNQADEEDDAVESMHHDSHDNEHEQTNTGMARKDGNLVPINTNFDLYSVGKDGKSKAPLRARESHDDIIYANDGGYIGIARDF